MSERDMLKRFRALDDFGQRLIRAVLEIEFERCNVDAVAKRPTASKSRTSKPAAPAAVKSAPVHGLPVPPPAGPNIADMFPDGVEFSAAFHAPRGVTEEEIMAEDRGDDYDDPA